VKKILMVFGAAALLFLGLWPVAVPETVLQNLIENAVGANNDTSVNVVGLQKGFFYSFKADRLTVQKAGRLLISIDDLSVKINPFSFFRMKLSAGYSGAAGGGSIRGAAEIFRKGNLIKLAVENAEIGELPFTSSAGLEGTGRLSGDLMLKDGSGELKFSLKEARLKSGAFSGITLPLDLFKEARGMLSITPGNIKVVSFTMEGEGIFARLSGDIRGRDLDMKMELMPGSSFIEKNPLILLLGIYKVSPGYYSVPVRTTMPF